MQESNQRVGYDAVIQAEAGFMFMNGEPGELSLKMPVALMDILAGHHLKEALLLAILNRERTGKGVSVEVSLIQAAVSSLANQATNWLMGGNLPQKQGSAHSNIAPYGDVFKTKDDNEIILAVGNDRQFEDLCIILDETALAKEKMFKTNRQRVINREKLNLILQRRIRNFNSSELTSVFEKYKIPAGTIKNLQQVFEMHEAMELLLNSMDLKGVKNFAALTPYSIQNTLLPPPHFGEHTEEVLRSLGSL